MALADVPPPPQSRFNAWSLPVNRILDGEGNGVTWHAHQRNALVWVREHLMQQPNSVALVVVPTGGGKSGIAALAPYVVNASRVLVITPSVTITIQLARDFGSRQFPTEQGQTVSFYTKIGLIRREQETDFVEPPFVVRRTDQVLEMHGHRLVIANAHKFGANANVDIGDIDPTLFDLVIVDEAHHYPAHTWRRIVDHFPDSRRLFLTATPFHRGRPILGPDRPFFEVLPEDLVARHIIREVGFREFQGGQEAFDVEYLTSLRVAVARYLDEHDRLAPRYAHQAMILTRMMDEADRVAAFLSAGGLVAQAYHQGIRGTGPHDAFVQGATRVLVVCGRLLEGFDRKNVSVCVVLRNVALQSRVLFSQFVGRCVRTLSDDDPITAIVLSHPLHNQQQNFDNLNLVAEVDPEEDQD